MSGERRFIEMEIQRKDDIVHGYAAVFKRNSLPLPLSWGDTFIEVLDERAFDGVLDNDVVALFNHDSRMVLGRTRSGTAKIGVDSTGLHYEAKIPKSRSDVYEMIERGDVTGSSFAFDVDGGETWTMTEPGKYLRVVTKVSRLYDVGPVLFPAYPDTTTASRSLEQLQKQQKAYSAGLIGLRMQMIESGLII